MKFFTTFATGLTFIASVTAAPTLSPEDVELVPKSDVNELQARAGCPSVEDIQAWLRQNTQIGEKTVFYTGTAGNRDAQNYANAIGGHFWGNIYSTGQQLDWLGECGPGPEQDKLIPRMAAAMAKEARGETFVMINKGDSVRSASIWMTAEYPNLKGRVKVTAVNPRNHNDKKEWAPGTSWKRYLGLDYIFAWE
ncbi:hypothetical protein AAE478_007693 [Parahypoxylon ruwenzoriense]